MVLKTFYALFFFLSHSTFLSICTSTIAPTGSNDFKRLCFNFNGMKAIFTPKEGECTPFKLNIY